MSEDLLCFVAIIIVALFASYVVGKRIEVCEEQGLEYSYFVGLCKTKN